jgi:hypothetical protein
VPQGGAGGLGAVLPQMPCAFGHEELGAKIGLGDDLVVDDGQEPIPARTSF